ncbi:MAG: sensor histidine kinase [Candidatus Paceibacterota bacterium]
MAKKHLVLDQYREGSEYNDFMGDYYHFPKKYLKQLSSGNIEFIYFEPKSKGKGVYYGSGKITDKPFKDKREDGYYFIKVANYKQFSNPVPFLNESGEPRETKPHYNPQNAVRLIDDDTLNEICLDGGINLSFKADAHLVQVLGEQLIASERVGILELVKNAFDAGANNCLVRIEKVPNLTKVPITLYKFGSYSGPIIVITDDGSGMTKEEIELGWLRPASTLKTNVKDQLKRDREKAKKEGKLKAFKRIYEQAKKANNGRIPLGEKGVGRFACNRLGSKLIIKTKTQENEYEYILKIDWDDFNLLNGEHKDLDEVKVSLTRQPPSRDYGITKSGTQLIIYGGREGFKLTESEIKAINRTILKLNSPNPHPNSESSQFNVLFECPQVKELDEEITWKKFDPVFTLSGIVDEWGSFNYDYSFFPPYNIPLSPFNLKDKSLDLKTIESDKWLVNGEQSKEWRKPECGAFFIHIDVWYRDKPWIGSTAEEREFKKYLENYGGISVYRDGINVHSSEISTENDWLGLRQRQLKQTYRISYYHMMGNIEIDQSSNVDLIDKTNREGMIKNQAFRDFTNLVKAVTYFIENDYINKRNEYKVLSGDLVDNPKPLINFSKQSAKIISNITSNYDLALDSYSLFENIKELGDVSQRHGRLVQLSKSLQNLEKNLKQIEEVQEMLTEQAGFGLGIAVALHEITKSTSNFYYGILDVLEKGEFDEKKLVELKETSKALESEILRLSPLRALRNEESIDFKVSKSIKYVHSVFKRRFNKLNIRFEYNNDMDFEINARYGALNQILTNIFDNSCYWLNNPKFKDRKIQVKVDSSERYIVIADSGPGFHDSILPYLFHPGASLKFPPSGIGLYVCKHYMNHMKKRGDIYLAKGRDRINDLNGAQLILDFSQVRG